jgi:hypothetical protein
MAARLSALRASRTLPASVQLENKNSGRRSQGACRQRKVTLSLTLTEQRLSHENVIERSCTKQSE